MSESIRHQLDAPMRKVREELGLPPLDAAVQSRRGGKSLAMEAILEYSGRLTEDQKAHLRAEWAKTHTDNAHRMAILPAGCRMTTSTGPR